MTGPAAIALGSNLDPAGGLAGGSGEDGREVNLREAIDRVRRLGEVVAVSCFYDTAPEGNEDQPRFLNGALLLKTGMQPVELLRELLGVEREMGRTRTGIAKGPRVIDLDLLLYGRTVMVTAELVLPHPALQERRFVLEPLAEIAPEMVHPVLRLTVAELLLRLRGGAAGVVG